MPAQVRARATLYLTSRFFSSPPTNFHLVW